MIKSPTVKQPKVAVKKIDTSYGANMPQTDLRQSSRVLPPKITPSSSVVNGVDTSYAANMRVPTPTTPAVKVGAVDNSYGANMGRFVSAVQTPSALQQPKNGRYEQYKDIIANAKAASQRTTANTTQEQAAAAQGATDAAPMTYEQFIAQQNQLAQENLNSQNRLIDQQKQQSVEQAEQEKYRAIVDARSSYEQNKATYGANAETLAGMGLAGSGYSDYISSQAYAQQRADTQQAKAQETIARQQAESVASQQKLESQMRYEDYLAQNNEKLFAYQEEQKQIEEQRTTEKNNNYANLLNGVNSGAYTAEQASTLADTFGLDAAQKQSLIDAATKYNTDRYNAGNAQIAASVANGEANKTTLDTALESDLISQEQYNTQLNAYQTQNYDELTLYVKSGDEDIDIDQIDIVLKNGDISQAHYEKLKEDWNNAIDTKSTAFDSCGSYQEAKARYEGYLDNKWLSQATKSALEKAFVDYETKYFASNVSSGYNAHSSTVTLNTPFGKHTVTYKVAKYSISVDDSIVKNAGSGQVFLKNGKVYVKLDDGKLGEINDYWGQGAFEALKNMYSGTVYDLDK